MQLFMDFVFCKARVSERQEQDTLSVARLILYSALLSLKLPAGNEP